jgi:hypothetical protein
MNSKYLPWLLLFCALGLSSTAAYYSVVGLSIIFSAVAIPVIIMGSFLELSKIAIATYLHDKWSETYGILKIYLTIAIVTLSILTSIGIYGLLSTGFQKNIAGLEVNNKKIENLEVKKTRFEQIKGEYQKEKNSLDKDITNLRNALSSNTTTQTVDRTTGQLITRANGQNRIAFEGQLKVAQVNRDELSKKIEGLNDSITNIDLKVLDMTSSEIESGELGSIKYLSEITGWDIKKTANFFILTLIFVFDPLAIALVIATNQAFKNYRKKEEETPQVTFQDEKEIETIFNEEEIIEEEIEDEETILNDLDENERIWQKYEKIKNPVLEKYGLLEDLPFDIQLSLENEEIDDQPVIQLNENKYEESMEPKNEKEVDLQSKELVEEVVDTIVEEKDEMFDDVDYWTINNEEENKVVQEEIAVEVVETPEPIKLNTNVRRLIYSKNA